MSKSKCYFNYEDYQKDKINKNKCYFDYKDYHQHRPSEEEFKISEYDNGKRYIEIRTIFPKNIRKNTYIISALGPVSYDTVLEAQALFALKKPLQVCATSGHWEGTPFLLYTKDDFFITEEDEKFIYNYKRNKQNL